MLFDMPASLLFQPSTQQSALIEELRAKELASATNMLLHLLNERGMNPPLFELPPFVAAQPIAPMLPLVAQTTDLPPSPLSPTTSSGTISPSTSSVDGSSEEDDRRPHQCPECLKRFRFKSNLFEHRSLHQQSTPFVCIFCSKTCRLKGNLKKHLAVHMPSAEALEALWKARFSRASGRPRKQPAAQQPPLQQQQLPAPMATRPFAAHLPLTPTVAGMHQAAFMDLNSFVPSAFNRF